VSAFTTGHALGMRRLWSTGFLLAVCAIGLLVGFTTASSIEYWAADSCSLVGVASQLGLARGAAAVMMVAVGGALLAMGWLYGRRCDDRRAFTCAIAAALALTPIAWVHYVWLLLVPLGLAQPRFSAIWLLPLVTWLVPRSGNGDGLEPFVPASVAALLVSFMLGPRSEDLEALEAT
jgi:hypothetical protein